MSNKNEVNNSRPHLSRETESSFKFDFLKLDKYFEYVR